MNLPIAMLAAGGGILGAIFGSFIGALCSRWPQGRSVLSGRSHCDGCSRVLTAAELIPLVSFLSRKGRCRACHAQIDPLQFVAELIAAATGLFAFSLLPLQDALVLAIMGWLMLPLLLLDIRHLWLPDRLIAVFALCGPMVGYVLIAEYNILLQIAAAAFAFAAMELLRRGFRALRHKEGMGAGDPKLLGAIALWLPPASLPYLLLIGSALGLGYVLLLTKKANAPNDKIPFGAMLCVSALILQFVQFW